MAKEVTHLEPVEQSRGPVGPSKITHVVRCDDGSVYEFGQLPGDIPSFERRHTGSGWSNSRAQFPEDVTESLNEEFGEDGWRK